MGDGEPPVGGLTEIGANLVERLALGVAARKCGDGGKIAARVWFRADNRGEIDADIDDNGSSSGRGMARDQGPPIDVPYRG